MPFTALAIGSIAAPVIGGIMGQNAAAGDRAAAQAAYEKAYSQYKNLNIPDEEKMKLALESPEVQGILQPYMEQAQQIGPSAMEDIAVDPRLRTAQMNALDTLSKMGSEGLTAEDRAALNASRRAVGGDEQARQQAILQSMDNRGAGGSGVELAARLSSSQGAAERAAQQSDNLMAMAQRRMLDAVAQAGQLGGQIRSQDHGEQSALASAKDRIAEFNASQRANVNMRNTAGMNSAQAANLAERQRLSESGVATRNAQQQYNKQLGQQTFDNEMSLRGAKANAAAGQAQQYQRSAQATADMYSGIGAAVGQAGMGYLNYQQGQQKLQQNAQNSANAALNRLANDPNAMGKS